MSKAKFLIVSMNKKAALFLRTTLNNVFEGAIEISAYSFIDDNPALLRRQLEKLPALIMATGVTSYKTLLNYYPKEKCLMASRDVSAPEYFDKLFLIPKGMKVLIVNETKNGSLETVEAIKKLGIHHLTCVPYWQNCNVDISGIDTAVSPGMLQYCPPGIPNKIDIGMRNLSINTFIKILQVYGLKTDYIDKYIERQKKVLIDTYEKLSTEFVRSNKLRNSLQTIINELDEAIISINVDYRITSMNSAAEVLLGVSQKNSINKEIYSLFENVPEMHRAGKISSINTIVTINNNQVYLTYVPLNNDETNIGVFKLQEVNDIKRNEEKIRKLIYQKNKGHIAKYSFEDIVAECQSMTDLINNTKFFAKNNSTILIAGESGTGKEMFAQSIHNYSVRAKNPFIAVNFAALPENLIESELFGYDEGAFTGAKKSGKKGLFELAHTGTIFLDEIGSASLWVQTRLLRVLEEREIMRLGDTKIIPVDIRIIAATNKDLKKLVEEGKFRADLYYRINVFQIHIPPLRERKDSLPQLIRILLQKHNSDKTFSEAAMKQLVNYNWAGNVRELRNMIEYSSQISKNQVIEARDLPYDIKSFNSCLANIPIQPDNKTYYLLKSFFDIEHIICILDIIKNNKNRIRKVGRNNILLILKEDNIHISDRTLRTILRHLESYELISVGKTKQGTVLSEKGEEFLSTMRKYHICQRRDEFDPKGMPPVLR
ncbi:MAG: sigma-54 interaction domain-containing protein [Negativicutes bacterium]